MAKTITKTRGYLTGYGKTAKEAKASLEKQIDWACSHSSTIIESRFGLIIIVSAYPGGYETSVFDPADLEHGKQRYCSTCHGPIEYTDALLSARMHAAQNAWHSERLDDAEHVERAGLTPSKARELADWIAWQRRFIAASKAGATVNEAHEIASGLRNPQ